MDYTLKSGENVIVVSDIGATVKEFKMNGEDIFFPYFIGKDKKARGGCPICSPWFGSIPEFSKEKHGYIRTMKATDIVKRGPNAMEFVFNCPGTSQYPWTLFHEVKVEIMHHGLHICLKITRLDDGLSDRAFINPGFHPYFSGWAQGVVVVSNSGKFSGFSDNAKVCEVGGRGLVIEKSDKKIAMLFEGDFSKSSKAVLWTNDPEKYFCVEPILRDPKEGIKIGIGESVKIATVISPF